MNKRRTRFHPKEKVRRYKINDAIFTCAICRQVVEKKDLAYVFGVVPGRGVRVCYRHFGEDPDLFKSHRAVGWMV